jgi:uncharacterized membrane protein
MERKHYVLTILFVHLFVYAVVLFDIPIMRQIFVFLYLSFVPGFAFLTILKVEKLDLLDLVLFSVGISVALSMFVGLFVNQVYPFIGFSQPLSTLPLLLTVTGLTLFLSIIGCRQGIPSIFDSISFNKITQFPLLKAIPLFFIPILSIYTALYARGAASILIILIAFLFVIAALSSKIIPAKLYPLLIFVLGLSLALQFTLMSTHVMGNDAPLEYYVYRLTAIGGHWVPSNIGGWPATAYNSMLSITVLPQVYSVLSNVNGELLFKTLYSVMFSLVPVVLFKILAKEQWKLGALLAALFFISSPIVFYGGEALALNRQMLAELFLLLSVFLLIKKQFSTRANQFIFIFLGVALAVSHYSLMIIYLGFLVVVFLLNREKNDPNRLLNGGVILVLFGIAISWYTFIPSGLINQMSNWFTNIVSRFSADLVNPEARSNVLFASTPVYASSRVASAFNWGLFGIAHFFVVFGILAVILDRQEIKLDFKYRLLIVLSSLLLVLAVAVPNFAPILSFTRFYSIAFIFLAPCFVFGAVFLFIVIKNITAKIIGYHNLRTTHVRSAMLLIGIVASAYFLAQSGLITHYVGASPLSYTIDWDRMRTSPDPNIKTQFYISFTPEQDVVSASWLSKFKSNDSLVYSDWVSMAHPLEIWGLISKSNLVTLENYTNMKPDSYLYLRYFNTVNGLVAPSPDLSYNLTAISPILAKTDCLYTNGASEIYSSHPG